MSTENIIKPEVTSKKEEKELKLSLVENEKKMKAMEEQINKMMKMMQKLVIEKSEELTLHPFPNNPGLGSRHHLCIPTS